MPNSPNKIMKNILPYAKGILFGVIGSLIGIIPNAILKTLLIDTFIGDFCFDYTFFKIGWDTNIGFSPCGIMSLPMSLMGLLTTLMLFILGGALFGLIGYIIAEKQGRSLGKENWRGLFWWSFVGGILFDLIFMFTVIFPGY